MATSPPLSPCDCSSQISQLTFEIQNQSAIDFEAILQLESRFTERCDAMKACEYCLSNGHSLITLQPLILLMLEILEAGCALYTLETQEMRFETPSPTSYKMFSESIPPSSDPQRQYLTQRNGLRTQLHQFKQQIRVPHVENLVCLPSEMTWGNAELDGEDGRLLVKVLLRRRLMSLGAHLEELMGMLARIWHIDWTNQTDMLRACETSISSAMDRLTVLVGQLEGR